MSLGYVTVHGRTIEVESDETANFIKISLDLSNKGISDISEIRGLESLENLQGLNLNDNQITEIKGLDKLNLFQLGIDRNQITEIKGLDKLSSLQFLNLNGNQITEIKGLDKLTNLFSLSLENNQITEIKGLERLTSLRQIFLNGNPLSINLIENILGRTIINDDLNLFEGPTLVEYCQKQSKTSPCPICRNSTEYRDLILCKDCGQNFCPNCFDNGLGVCVQCKKKIEMLAPKAQQQSQQVIVQAPSAAAANNTQSLLDKLEERFIMGEISEETYKELKAKLEAKLER